MGATHRFLALDDDLRQVDGWFAALPEPPVVIQGRDCRFLHFQAMAGLRYAPGTDQFDPNCSPIASVFPPEQLRTILWTAGEVHFLPTPLRRLFPKLDDVSRRFSKWLHEFECVYEGPGTSGEWDYFLEGGLRNYDAPIFAMPSAMAALRGGQYFVARGFGGDSLNRLCRSLELRGVRGGTADA